MPYVYILRCADNSLYTGMAGDIPRRMQEHREGGKAGAKYTRSRHPVSLEMVWETKERSGAARVENLIKTLKKPQKEELLRCPGELEGVFGDRLKGTVCRPCREFCGAHYFMEETKKEETQMDETRLSRQLAFLLEIDRQKEIVRQTYLASASRKETDAEHAWHMAVMCQVLSEYANEPIDVPKTVMMLLTHDLVEIDAGDTYAYDEQGNATKRKRELAAAERIYGLLPEDQQAYFRGLWDEFEAMETPEARFANMLDKVQPILLNDASEGKSWLEHGVQEEQILKRNARTHEGSELLWDYARKRIEKNAEAGRIRRDAGKENS